MTDSSGEAANKTSANEESCLVAEDFADAIIEQIGDDHSSDSRIVYDARWSDDTTFRKYELKKKVIDDKERYRLSVFENLDHSPSLIFLLWSSSTEAKVTNATGVSLSKDFPPVSAKLDMKLHLQSANILPNMDQSRCAITQRFKELTYLYAATMPAVDKVIRSRDNLRNDLPYNIWRGAVRSAIVHSELEFCQTEEAAIIRANRDWRGVTVDDTPTNPELPSGQ